MLEMKLDESGLASARYLLVEMPLSDKEAKTVERVGTRFDAESGKFFSEHSESRFDQAVIEIAATTGLPKKHARTALLQSTAVQGTAVQRAALQDTAQAGTRLRPETQEPEPFYIDAHPPLESRENEAQAKQRAFELSKLLPRAEATVIGPDGEDIALYKGGALYSPQTGEQLTPAF